MNNDYNNPAFKKLLQKLQEESWQLELLISGFAIFGLFSAYDSIELGIKEAQVNDLMYKGVIYTVAFFACIILIFNLLLHVLLRGLWIGALGLRYVSGDIDYETLNYSEKFSKYLKKKVGSFDKYIGTLENYCSIIFAISFLLIFYVLALTFTMLSFVIIVEYILQNEALPEWLRMPLGIILILFLSIGLLLTFVDFMTQGWLKKKKWLSKIYFPFYWVFSFITLSFLYKPIVYNFLDNKFGKRISFVLFPLFVILILATSYQYNHSNYFNNLMSSNTYITSDNNYEDLAAQNDMLIDDASIQSKVIKDNYLRVYIKYTKTIEDNIFVLNKGLKPEIDRRGLESGMSAGWRVASAKNINKDSLKLEYLKTLNCLHTLKIDSTTYKSDFVVNKNKLGFETYISTKGLTEGKHTLHLLSKKIKEKDTVDVKYKDILFWYYPD